MFRGDRDETPPVEGEVSSEPSEQKQPFIPVVLPGPPDLSDRTPIPDQLETRVTRYSDGTVDLNAALASSRKLYKAEDPGIDLELVSQIFGHYRYIYQTNPVGSENEEITIQFLGCNPKNVVFLDPVAVNLSPNHELLDRWGNPFVFHPLTSKEMEVRSHGPDGKPWTEDDLSQENRSVRDELQLK